MNSIEFEKLYRMHYSNLCRYVFSYCNDRNLAEDIVQDSMLKLWKSKSNINHVKGIKTYLYTSCYRTMLDDFNKKKDISLDFITHKKEIIDGGDEYYSDEYDLRRALLKSAIKNLPQKCRDVFILVKLNRFSHKQVSETLNISVKTIENQITYAMKSIRKEMFAEIEKKKAI